MKRYFLFFLLFGAFVMCRPDSAKVYVCDSVKTVAYHRLKNCRGLQKCTHTILYMPLDSAKLRGLRACLICY